MVVLLAQLMYPAHSYDIKLISLSELPKIKFLCVNQKQPMKLDFSILSLQRPEAYEDFPIFTLLLLILKKKKLKPKFELITFLLLEIILTIELFFFC